jgi:hypothetical protein
MRHRPETPGIYIHIFEYNIYRILRGIAPKVKAISVLSVRIVSASQCSQRPAPDSDETPSAAAVYAIQDGSQSDFPSEVFDFNFCD